MKYLGILIIIALLTTTFTSNLSADGSETILRPTKCISFTMEDGCKGHKCFLQQECPYSTTINGSCPHGKSYTGTVIIEGLSSDCLPY